ncbi:unnamed protein product [Allacma fusca]|uniref:C2H2-type domain-containing protein n=1 Tax=Allacma fusca TaxID=39272 RepID=A0A8J2KDF0_9HEXA|nr:unnamed protein product [Allacma fusca]
MHTGGFTASVTLERRDKSIAEISQIPKGPLRKRKCSVKVEIPMLSESETVLKESMGSMEMESYDMNSSAVGDFKCEIESEKRVKNDAVKKDVQGYQNSVTMKGRAWKCGTCRLIFPSKGKFDSHILSSCHGVRRHVAKKSINLQNADGSLLSIALSVFKDSRKNLPTVDNAVVNHLGKCMSTKIKADNCFETHYLASSEECHQDQNVENKKETEKYSVILKDRIFKSGDKCFSESEEAKVDRCVETDNENYQPRSSESFEESGEDLGIEILPRNNDNSLVECEGSRRNKPKRRSPNFRIWKLADKIKQIDATHFVFDEKFPFEINDGVWKCGTCGLDFRTKRYLNSHLLSSCLRGSLKRYKFLELPEGKFKYGGHVFQKSGDDNFICAECDHVAETQEKVMGHIRSKHLNVNSCRRFEEIEELPASKISYAGIIIEKSGDKFKCSDCFQTAGTQAELVNHIRSNHMVGLGRRRNLKVTELGHNRYQYGDTYHFEITDIGLFRCLTCDMHCHRRHRITEHIFVCHIRES